MKPSIPRLAASAAALLLVLSLIPIWPSGYYLLLTYLVGITAVFMVVRAQEIRVTTMDDDLDCHRRPLQSHRSLAPAGTALPVRESRLRGAFSHLCTPISFVTVRPYDAELDFGPG